MESIEEYIYWMNNYVANRRNTSEYDVYIGKGSKWYNPYVAKNMSYDKRLAVIRDYEKYLYTSGLINDIHELKGKVLGCYCKPLPCHGMILAKLANEEIIVESPVTERHFMHSNYDRKTDVVVIKERLVHADGTQSTNMKVIKEPKRPIFITKPEFRSHDFKLEREVLAKLDKVIVPEKTKLEHVSRLLGLPKKTFYKKDEVYKSPYVYGANVEIEALLKMSYRDVLGEDKQVIPTVGFLDVENDIETKEISLNSFLSASGTCYTAVLNSKMWKMDGINRVRVTPEDMESFVNAQLDAYLVKENFKVKFEIPKYKIVFGFCDTPLEMLLFIFKAIHKEQNDYIGAWSDHDIKMIMNTIKNDTKFSYADFFTDPSLDRKHRTFYWDDGEKGMKEGSHFTHRWSWVHSNCSSQFLNLIALYSQNRKTAPFRDSYKLEDVLQEFIGAGKFPKISEDHKIMADQYFREYTAYNIFDVIGLDLLERTTKDVTALHVLSGNSPVSVINRAVVTTTNDLYYNQRGLGYITSCPSTLELYSTFDGLFKSTGGTVLPPYMYDGFSVEIS